MMSYPVIDRDRARLVEELDLARQVEPTPVSRRKVGSRHWFRSSPVGREAVRAHLASF